MSDLLLKRVVVNVPLSVESHYEGFVSDGGTCVLVVQNNNFKDTAVVMSVKTGSFDDPEDYSGMAHFCEHMLFNGSTSFPAEDEFSSFVSKHSGVFNAFTKGMSTTFMSRIPDLFFEGLTERFLSFFCCPIFNSSCVSREVIAVHNEDLRYHSVDAWRFFEVLKSLCNAAHPFSRYNQGNKETLVKDEDNGDKLAMLVKEFYTKNYCASEMSLVVCTSRPVSDVVGVISPFLLKLPCDSSRQSPSHDFLTAKEDVLPLRRWINFLSQSEGQKLDLYFEVLSSSRDWKKKPSAYISYILGHECRTSALGVLKEHGLASEMSAGSSRCDESRDLFFVSVNLTVSGLSELEKVIITIFDSIRIAVVNGIDIQVYEGMKAELRLNFESTVISSPLDHCVELSENIIEADLANAFPLHYPIEDDFQLSLEYAKQLTPDRCTFILKWGGLPLHSSQEPEGELEPNNERLFLSLPHFAQIKAESTAKFSKAKYAVTSVPNDCIKDWSRYGASPFFNELQLPPKNEFLATDLTVYDSDVSNCCDRLNQVQKISSLHGVCYIRKSSGYHKSFVSSFICSMLSPICCSSPLHRCYTLLMIKCLENRTTELRYFGLLGSLENDFFPGALGLTILVNGPAEHLASFFLTLFDKAFSLDVLRGTEEMFKNFAFQLNQKLTNFRCNTASFIGLKKLKSAFAGYFVEEEELLEAMGDVSYAGYLDFLQEYLSSGVLFESFFSGNMKSVHDVEMSLLDRMESILKSFSPANVNDLQRVNDGFVMIPSPWTANPLSSDSSTVLSRYDLLFFRAFLHGNKNVSVSLNFFTGRASPRQCALIKCVKSLLSSSFFHALRTQETLGYAVQVRSSSYGEGYHLCFTVESGMDNVDSIYILSRMTAYFSAVESSLDSICSSEAVKELLDASISRLQQLPLSAKNDCDELVAGYFHPLGFNWRELELEATKSLTANDVKDFLLRSVFHKRQCKGLAVVIDRWHEAEYTYPSWTSPGEHQILVKPEKKVCDQSESAPQSGGTTLILPSFASESYSLLLSTKRGKMEYQRDLELVKSNIRFRDVPV